MGEKVLCLIAYLFSLPGALIVRMAGKNSKPCLHHARRSLELFLFIFFLFAAWAVIALLLTFIPYLGFPIAMAIFGIVVAASIFSLVLCIMGIVSVFREKTIIFPLITSLMRKIEPFFRFLGLSEE
jgi:uncharacterized membrane protein